MSELEVLSAEWEEFLVCPHCAQAVHISDIQVDAGYSMDCPLCGLQFRVPPRPLQVDMKEMRENFEEIAKLSPEEVERRTQEIVDQIRKWPVRK